ncbi:MAG: hypothetical protein M3P22_02490 [bacterium]|nr:hypothetical protein [bacterium]
MDEEVKNMLEETLALAKENNEMLHKVRGVQKQATFFRVVYWVFIILAGIGAFYFIQPYIDAVTNGVGEAKSTLSSFKDLFSN